MPALPYASTIAESPQPRSGPEPSIGPEPPRRPQVMVGSQIGKYRLTSVLGKGGFGTIWSAIDTESGAEVAVKVLRHEFVTSPDVMARFEREAEVISMLDHPNVVKLYEFGELPGGEPYFVMEYLPGSSLSRHIKRRGALTPNEILAIVEPLCEALSAAHARGVVHRDIKASNVMLCERDGRTRVVLLDFGIAKLLEADGPQITAPLSTIGSPYFMAPEQIRGERVDARTDIYALGILVFQLLTGELPFDGEAVLHRHLTERRPAPSTRAALPTSFDGVVQRAMAIRPCDRFAAADELLSALRAATRDYYGHADPTRRHRRTARAIGIYLDVVSAPGAEDEEGALDDLESIIPRAEDLLVARGFAVAYEYGNTALFVRALDPADDAVAKRCDAMADAMALHAELCRRPGAHDSVRVGLYLDIGDICVCGCEIEGGSLLEQAPALDALHGASYVFASEAYMRGIDSLAQRPSAA